MKNKIKIQGIIFLILISNCIPFVSSNEIESEWAILEVNMLKSNPQALNNITIEIRGGLGLKIIINNNGDTDIQGLEMTITMDAPWMLFGGGTTTTFDIPSGSEEIITTGFFLGFGPFNVTVKVLDISESRSGFLIGPFVILYPEVNIR